MKTIIEIEGKWTNKRLILTSELASAMDGDELTMFFEQTLIISVRRPIEEIDEDYINGFKKYLLEEAKWEDERLIEIISIKVYK